MFFGQPTEKLHGTKTIPAPVGGLNAYDSLVAMPPTDAVELKNWWPQPYGCTVRRGYREWATGLGGLIETLGVYSSQDGTQKLFAWTGAKLFDVTANAPVGDPLLDDLLGASWETIQMANAAGNHLLATSQPPANDQPKK